MARCVIVTIVGAAVVPRVAVFVPVRVATVAAAATAAAVSSSVRHVVECSVGTDGRDGSLSDRECRVSSETEVMRCVQECDSKRSRVLQRKNPEESEV